MDNNLFEGTIPTTLSKLSSLNILSLENNKITGSIPNIFPLSSLYSLDLSNNNLTGTIPSSIQFCSKLVSLTVSFNQISGQLPEGLTNLSNLVTLIASNNLISGTLPNSISNLSALTYIDFTNNRLFGTIPNSIMNLKSLTSIRFGNNNLHGTIPNQFNQLSKLIDLDFSYNGFSGSIPNSIVYCTLLTSIYINNNNFQGTIPTQLGNLVFLNKFIMSNNMITGSIPSSIGNIKKLGFFLANSNLLKNNLPFSIGNLSSLVNLDISNNQLVGPLPWVIGQIPTLISLQIFNNNLTCPLSSLLNPLLTTCDMYNNWLCGVSSSSIYNPKCYGLFPKSCKITACRIPNSGLPIQSSNSLLQFNNPNYPQSYIQLNTNYPSANIVVFDPRTSDISQLSVDLISLNENTMQNMNQIFNSSATLLNSFQLSQINWNLVRNNISSSTNKLIPLWTYSAYVPKIFGNISISFSYIPVGDNFYLENYFDYLSSGTLKISVSVDGWNLITRPPFSLPWAASLIFNLKSSKKFTFSPPISNITNFSSNFTFIYPFEFHNTKMHGQIQAVPVGQSGSPGTLNQNVYLVYTNSSDINIAQKNPGLNSVNMTTYFFMPSTSNVTYSFEMAVSLSKSPIPPPIPQILGNTIATAIWITLLLLIVLISIFALIMKKKPRWKRAILPCLGHARDPVLYI